MPPPLLAAVPAVIGYMQTGKVIWLIMGAIMVAGQVLLKPKTKDMSALSRGGQEDKGRLINTRNTAEVVPIAYGEGRYGGNQVFATTTGIDNKYLHMILTFAEGKVNKIKQVGGVDQIFLDDKLYTESDFAGYFTYEFFNGSATQNVCSTLHAAYPNWTDPLRYTAYLYCKFTYDRDKFSSVPVITIILEGDLVKNFATEDDYASMPMIYTNNLAYCAYDLLTRPSVRGGKELDPTRIDLPSFREAADYYNTYGWTCNMPINRDQAIEDNLDLLLVNGRSAIIYSDNKFKLKFRDTREESVVMQITEDDIIQQGKESTIEIQPAATLFSRPNAIKATFISADKNYHQDEKVFRDDDAYNNEGDYREQAIELLGLSSLDVIIPMSYYYLERARWGNLAGMLVGNKGISLEPMDLIEITHRMPGWTDVNKPMYRVEGVQLQEDGNVGLLLIQEDDALYNNDYDMDTQELFITDLLSPSATVQPVINISHSEEVYDYRGRSFTRWMIDFDPPTVEDYPFWDYAEIWLKIGAGSYKFMTKATSDWQIDPVEEGKTYYVKIRSVNIFGVKEDFDTAPVASKEIVGNIGAPSDISALTAVASGDTVTLFAEELSIPDIVGYEIRLGSAWVGGIFIGFNETPNIRLTCVRPGVHTFWMAAKSNAGVYSSNPVPAQCTVYYPPNYVDKNTWSWDFNGIGTHDNTEYGVYNEQDILKCSHDGGVLTGKWTSPVYDLGAIKTIKIWGEFSTVTPVTWLAVFGAETWDDVIAGGKRWYEILVPSEASQLRVKLKWGNVVDQLDNEADYFEILAPEIRGRYVQIEIEITDPSIDVYMYLYKLDMKAAYWQ